MPSVILKRLKTPRILLGHPWIYANEVAKVTAEPADGDAVDIRDHKNRFLGRGFYNSKSQIVVRRFTREKIEPDREFFRRKIESALRFRRQIFQNSDTFRVVNSESDELPGLILDKYGDILVAQTLTLGIERRKNLIYEIVKELLSPRAIVERNDVPTRKLEGLDESKGVIFGKLDGKIVAKIGEFSAEIDVLNGQKTGFFLDQRENYGEVAAFCAGKKVLDCFSYAGGFAISAAKAGAAQVELVDISEEAIESSHRNAELNDVPEKISFTCGNAFDILKQYSTEKRAFDAVILDPPSFTRTREAVDGALRGYKEINLRALKMLEAGGILATFSCSHHIGHELFESVVVEAAADAKKSLRLLKRLTQSRDHPILPAVPETEYLKGLLLQVM
jgi:23S rRNA (cytosine1962-C5)-methyltransferase